MKAENEWDAIVIGVGSMGASTCYELASRGMKVLGLDQFEGVHDRGSHGGHTRLIRQSYFEHPDYVPLLQRAYQKWEELEQKSGVQIFHKTGVLYIGDRKGPVLSGVLESSKAYHLELKEVNLKSSYPSLHVDANHSAILEPNAGFLEVDSALEAYRIQFLSLGGSLHENEKVLRWNVSESGVSVTTDKNVYSADKLVITAGAWTSQLMGHKFQFKVTRQVLAWFEVPDHCQPLPGWCLDHPDGLGIYYGFPPSPRGWKIGHHFHGKTTDPDKVDRLVSDEEKQELTRVMSSLLNEDEISINHTETCLYTNTDDEHFILDLVPDTDGRVVVGAGFSGHGFKFVSVVGEVLGDLVEQGSTHLPVEFLSLKRFT